MIEGFTLFIAIFAFFRFLRGTAGEGILKGFALLLVCAGMLTKYFASETVLDLKRLNFLLSSLFQVSVLAIIVIFHPELRRALVRLGATPFANLLFKGELNVIKEIVDSVVKMSAHKIGALICIERKVGLKTYIEGGIQLDALVRSELLNTIFYPGTALHDGAVIIRDRRVAAAGCLFPLSDSTRIGRDLGTRHRAAIGITEKSDAVTIAVSEETGIISVAINGTIKRELDRKSLEEFLRTIYTQDVPGKKQLENGAAALASGVEKRAVG